jgi:hypothetical protein
LFDDIAEKAGRALYLAAGISIEGNREMMIDNCRRIEECSEVFMSFVSGRLRIQIWGTGLRAYDYRTRGLVVRGRISRIDLIEKGGGES